MLFKLAVVLMLVLVLVSLFSGLFFLYRDKGDGERVLRALTLRVSLSVVLFVPFVAISYRRRGGLSGGRCRHRSQCPIGCRRLHRSRRGIGRGQVAYFRLRRAHDVATGDTGGLRNLGRNGASGNGRRAIFRCFKSLLNGTAEDGGLAVERQQERNLIG